MFPSVVSAGTVFTPGDGAGSVVSYWAMVVVATLGFIFALIAVLILIAGHKIEDPKENTVALMAFLAVFVAADFCFSGAAVFYRQSFPGDSTVEGTVVKVMDVGSDGAELLFDDGKSVRMYNSGNDLKDVQGLRVRLSCDSNKNTNDSFDDINKCEYEKVVSIPSSTPSGSSGEVQQKHNSS